MLLGTSHRPGAPTLTRRIDGDTCSTFKSSSARSGPKAGWVVAAGNSLAVETVPVAGRRLKRRGGGGGGSVVPCGAAGGRALPQRAHPTLAHYPTGHPFSIHPLPPSPRTCARDGRGVDAERRGAPAARRVAIPRPLGLGAVAPQGLEGGLGWGVGRVEVGATVRATPHDAGLALGRHLPAAPPNPLPAWLLHG